MSKDRQKGDQLIGTREAMEKQVPKKPRKMVRIGD